MPATTSNFDLMSASGNMLATQMFTPETSVLAMLSQRAHMLFSCVHLTYIQHTQLSTVSLKLTCNLCVCYRMAQWLPQAMLGAPWHTLHLKWQVQLILWWLASQMAA